MGDMQTQKSKNLMKYSEALKATHAGQNEVLLQALSKILDNDNSPSQVSQAKLPPITPYTKYKEEVLAQGRSPGDGVENLGTLKKKKEDRKPSMNKDEKDDTKKNASSCGRSKLQGSERVSKILHSEELSILAASRCTMVFLSPLALYVMERCSLLSEKPSMAVAVRFSCTELHVRD